MSDSAKKWHNAKEALGTTSLVLNAQGNVVSEARHYPYGEERWHASTLPTDYRFTGQAYEQSLGLYHMGARWYDGSLGRWLSADTLVPDPTNPQSLNRFSYVRNSPLKYRDPTGHADQVDDGGSAHYENPAVAAYYYELYVNNPELYAYMLENYPDHPSIAAVQAYSQSHHIRPVQEEIDYRAEKKEIAEKWAGRWEAVAQLGPDPGYASQVKDAWDTLNDFSNEMIEAAGDRTNDWVVQNGGPEAVADSAEVLEVVGLSVQKDTAMAGAYLFYLAPYGLALSWKTSLQFSLLLGLKADLARLELKY